LEKGYPGSAQHKIPQPTSYIYF